MKSCIRYVATYLLKIKLFLVNNAVCFCMYWVSCSIHFSNVRIFYQLTALLSHLTVSSSSAGEQIRIAPWFVKGFYGVSPETPSQINHTLFSVSTWRLFSIPTTWYIYPLLKVAYHRIMDMQPMSIVWGTSTWA